MRLFLILACLSIVLSGCQTMDVGTQKQEDLEMLGVVAESISGKEISNEELRRIGRELRTDEEARSAVKAISDSLGGEERIIKYCPTDGERYSANFIDCPKHSVTLEIVN